MSSTSTTSPTPQPRRICGASSTRSRESTTTSRSPTPVKTRFEIAGEIGRIVGRVSDRGSDCGLYFAHATGFCKELWDPVIGYVQAGGVGAEFVSWDSAAHGESDEGEPPYDWWSFAQDALSVVDLFDHRSRIGIGHSMGGAALAMAEILRPGTFDRLVLVEPITFPPPFGRFDIPLADVALRRRRVFPSAEAAHRNFTDKHVFKRWEPAALDSYVAGGLQETDGEWILRCSPESEAEVYLGGTAHGAYDRLKEIEIPALLIAGEHSSTHDLRLMNALAAQLSDGSMAVVPGAGHFVPMEQPAALADLVLRFINR